MRARGFSLLEVMVAMAIAGIFVSNAVSAFAGSIHANADAKRSWVAFTIAQQQMEILSAIPVTALALAHNSTAVNLGKTADASCNGLPASLIRRVNTFGVADPKGFFELCWRVTVGSPARELRNIRVIVNYPKMASQEVAHVVLQTIR